uniref:Uncharacterized protein n=1 Tax=Roseihalotalea indica TaxID=2867963 RepID=A0AA49GNQ2_9BACT|nr:hypothetical protein K4G66_18850 [Tunicatimonas sp. TK19036]
MEKTIEVKSDMRVKELLSVLQMIEDAKCHVIQRIDSVNYGEGYEIRIYGVRGRIYDDDRSDEARQDKDFISKRISWEEAMNRAAEKMKENVWLKIEIDRWSESKAEVQANVVRSIRDYLRKNEYNVA